LWRWGLKRGLAGFDEFRVIGGYSGKELVSKATLRDALVACNFGFLWLESGCCGAGFAAELRELGDAAKQRVIFSRGS
jgi:hypothetical protein